MRTVNATFEIVFTSRGWMDGYVVTKISRILKLPFFLTRGAPLRVLIASTRAPSSAMNIGNEDIFEIIIIFFN